MNNGFTPERYAEIVNVYGSRLRAIAPNARIVACGQKRSNDMDWSEKVIDLAGENFDILGCHNYEYEPENFETGLRRIRDYLAKLRDYVRDLEAPAHRDRRARSGACQHTYDWRAGLHAAGSLMMYEELSPGLTMTCPALLMRNTTDDPTWTSFIYHDHVSWFPGGGLRGRETLSRALRGAVSCLHQRSVPRHARPQNSCSSKISTAKPEDWLPGSIDAIATASADGRRIVIKAVNYTSRTKHPAGAAARRQGSGKGGRDVAHHTRRTDRFRLAGTSRRHRAGDPNDHLRQGSGGGSGALRGCGTRDWTRMTRST